MRKYVVNETKKKMSKKDVMNLKKGDWVYIETIGAQTQSIYRAVVMQVTKRIITFAAACENQDEALFRFGPSIPHPLSITKKDLFLEKTTERIYYFE